MTSQRKRFSKSPDGDPLKEPIVKPQPLLVALMSNGKSPEAQAAMWRAADTWPIQEKYRKLGLLACRYKIDVSSNDGWILLALRLAEEIYEGFRVVEVPQPAKRRGRPSGSTKIGGLDLVKAVELAKLPTDRGILDACRRLTRRGRWKNENPKSLQTQYYAHLRKMKKVLEAANEAWEADPLIRRLEEAAKMTGGKS